MNKTVPTKDNVSAFIKTLGDPKVISETQKLIEVFEKVTKTKPVLWGKMIGFGSYHYVYDSGREGDMFAAGFAVRKNAFTVYSMGSSNSDLLEKLGKHKLSGSCLHIKNLSDIDLQILGKLITAGIKELKSKYKVTLK